MSYYSYYNKPTKSKKPYTRSPEIQAKLDIAREEALERLRHDAKPIYEYIKGECHMLSLRAVDDLTLQFFYRQDKWWLRKTRDKICAEFKLEHDCHVRAALMWLIKEGYVLEDNFDADYCSTKWYAISDKPFT